MAWGLRRICSTAALAKVSTIHWSLQARSKDCLSTDKWGTCHLDDASCIMHSPAPASAGGRDSTGAGDSVDYMTLCIGEAGERHSLHIAYTLLGC